MIDLHLGDCLKVMKNMPDKSVDLVLTDPPYGINFQSNMRKKQFPKIINDNTPFVAFIPDLKRIIKRTGAVMVFTRWDVQPVFIAHKVRNVLIWDKMRYGMGDLKRAYSNGYESIIFSSEQDFRFPAKRPQDIVQMPRISPNKLIHPNEKPVLLLKKLITQCTQEGNTVFDPFMGSGSTGVACANTNRNFIGIELDKGYFEIAQKRIKEAQGDNDIHNQF